MADKPEKITINIRGVDRETYRKARARAYETGKTMGQYISEALTQRLVVDQGKKSTS